MIILDSIGFAATHAHTDRLSALPDTVVTHGSRRFPEGGPLGQNDQSPEEFLRNMRATAQTGARCIALHCVFPPEAMHRLCAEQGVTHRVLVRSPRAQTESCFAWALNKVLGGNTGIYLQTIRHCSEYLQPIGVQPHFVNALYAWAMFHVAGFNMQALASGSPILRTEDLLEDDAAFREAFDLPGDLPLPEVPRGVSHRARTAQVQRTEPDRDAILGRLQVNVKGRALSWSQYCAALGYPGEGAGEGTGKAQA